MAASRSPRAAPPPGGVNNADCNDTEVCTFDQCLSGTCRHSLDLYGGVDHDDNVALFDPFSILNGLGGDFSTCSFEKCDLDPSEGDADVDLLDLFAILNAFSDIDRCCGLRRGFMQLALKGPEVSHGLGIGNPQSGDLVGSMPC